MRSHGQRGRGRRAAIGVLVLYALVLQALLGGVAAARMSVQAPGVICLDHAGEDAGERDGDAHDAACCGTACRPVQATLPASVSASSRPVRPALTRERIWRALLVDGPPAPAHASARPRAPPTVA